MNTSIKRRILLISAIASGQAYLNIHSSTFGGGEIRGFLVPVPEPSAFALVGLGALGFVAKRLRRGKIA